MRRFKVSLAIILLAFVLVACATTPAPQSMTPKQQATVFLQTYNAVYDDTMSMATNPNATQAQKDMVVKKKAILTQVWPLLKAYTSIVDGGGTPTPESTAQLTNLINQLTTLAGGK